MSPLPRRPHAALIASLLCGTCGGGGGGDGTLAPGAPPAPWTWALPAGWAAPVVPADNPMNAAKVELGRHLFYDARLSGNGTLSCAGCHAPDRAFTDNRALGRGATGQNHPRNTPTLVNVAYRAALDWARPAPRTLEEQMRTPLFGSAPVEMGVNDANRDAVLQRLQGDAPYRARFAAAFIGEAAPIHWDNVIRAIAAFERTLVSAASRHDLAQAGRAPLNAQEQRGQRLFFGPQALCASCHGGPNLGGGFVSSGGGGGPAFSNIGLFNIGGSGAYPELNRGVFETTRAAGDMGRFRAPSLRNVALTAPYFHDGSAPTLEAAVQVHAQHGRAIGNGPYAGDGRSNPFKDPLIDQIELSDQDQADLVAFLKTLTDTGVASDPRFADPFAP